MYQQTSRSIGLGFAALATFLVGGITTRAASPEKVEWRTDVSRAHAEARTFHRMIWLQFTGSWCQFCHQMERQTFVDPRVVDRAHDNFVPVKIQSDFHEDLIVRFNISGLPATVIVGPSGEVIAKHEGFVEATPFVTFLDTARARFVQSAGPAYTSPARPQPVAPEVGVALAGYCPVSLVQEHRLVVGQDGVSLQHDGRVYRFANADVRGAFERQPERFIPVNGGHCPVYQVDRAQSRVGNPRFGILYQGHLYLCADEASRISFLKDPGRYCHVDLADRQLCPHCWGRDFLLTKRRAPWWRIRAHESIDMAGRTDPGMPALPEETAQR